MVHKGSLRRKVDWRLAQLLRVRLRLVMWQRCAARCLLLAVWNVLLRHAIGNSLPTAGSRRGRFAPENAGGCCMLRCRRATASCTWAGDQRLPLRLRRPVLLLGRP